MRRLTSLKRQLERLSTDFYDWCNDCVCTSAQSRVYEHSEMLMSQEMQMGLLSPSAERQKRFSAPRLAEKMLTIRKHGLDRAIRFWITHNYVTNCPRKSSRFSTCSFGRDIALTKLVVSRKRRQMQRVFMCTFFIALRHTVRPRGESHVSCYILYMDSLKHSTRIMGAMFKKSTLCEMFMPNNEILVIFIAYSEYSFQLFSYYIFVLHVHILLVLLVLANFRCTYNPLNSTTSSGGRNSKFLFSFLVYLIGIFTMTSVL
jgi:hypothetical protein